MYTEDDKRAIDDPGLNQDSTYDKKDEESFDDSDDFHKYDDTEKDKKTDEKGKKQSGTKTKILNTDTKPLNDSGRFDGNISI